EIPRAESPEIVVPVAIVVAANRSGDRIMLGPDRACPRAGGCDTGRSDSDRGDSDRGDSDRGHAGRGDSRGGRAGGIVDRPDVSRGSMAAAAMAAATTTFTRAARSRRPHQGGHTQNQDAGPKKDASHDRSSVIVDLSPAGGTFLVIVRPASCARLLARRFLQGVDLGVP